MKKIVIICLSWLISALVCFALASIAHSQFVVAGLVGLGIEISIADRVAMTLADMRGLLLGYGSVLGIALGLGFGLVAAGSKWLRPLPEFCYPLAGFIAVATALTAMQPLLEVTLIAGARGAPGFITQCLAGLVAGWAFKRQACCLLVQQSATRDKPVIG